MAIERRGAERKRRASDHMFQAMFMAMDEGVVARNGNGEIAAVNPAAENILGLTAAEWIGRSSTDFARALRLIGEDETPLPWERHPSTLAMQTGKPQRNVVMGAHRPDGTLVWISCNAQPLPSHGESGPDGVVTTFRDITERMRMEDDIRRRELEFRSLAENMPDGLVRYDRQARAQYMNPAILADIAPEGRPVLGESLMETFPGNDAQANLHRLIERVIATGTPVEVEFQPPNLCGEMRTRQVRYVAERDSNGEIIGALGIGRDITERKASERQLRQALEFTQGVINAIPDLLFEADRDGICLNVWARTPELLAMHKEALLGKRVTDVVTPDTAEVALAAIREADEKGLSFGKVLRVDIPQGERWFELSVSKKPGSDVPGRFIVLSRNVTERKRMEDNIRGRELEFRSLAENIPDNVVRYDRQGRVLYFNPALSTSLAPELMPVLGLSAAEASRGRESLMAYHQAVERVIATGMPSEFEFQLPNPRGETRDHRVHIVAERDGDGDIIGALSIGRDVTERKRMEQAVAVREQEFRSLAENSRDRIIRYDRDGRVRYLNAQLLAFFGMSATDIIGRRTREVWPDGCYGGIERACAHAVEAGEATTVEFDIADAAGVLRSNQVVVVPERDSAGQIIGSLAFGRDITALRETERQLRHFIENLPGMAYTFRLSPEGHTYLPYVSPAIKELFGLEPDDVKEDTAPLCQLAHPEDRARIEAATAESARTMTPYRVEYRVCRPDRPERWVDQRCVPEREVDGSIVWYGILLDITERKLAEEYEQFRSRTLELLSAGAPLPVVLEAIVRGVEQLQPNMICSILLLDKQGKTLGEGVAPSLPDFYNAAVDGLEIGVGAGCCGTVAATGERVVADDIMTHPYWANYKELAAKAGLAACWSEPIRASSGKVLGTFAVYHRQAHSPTPFDIDLIEKSTHLVSIAIERRRAEEALRARELEFRTLAENLPDFLVRYDREGRRTYINPTMGRVFALGPDQMLGSSLRRDNPANLPTPEAYLRALEHTLATGERSEFEMEFCPSSGGTRTGLCFIVAERGSDGQITGAIAVTRDITEQKRTEVRLALQARRAEVLLELPDASEAMDEVAFMQRGQELAEELTGSSIAFIHFVNEGEDSIDLVTWSRRTLEHFCRASFDKHYPTSEAGIWADALRQRRPVVFNDYAAYPHRRGMPEGHAELTRLISLPVIENGKVVMLAGVGNKPADYTDLDVETVQLIANDIWRIVQRKRTDKQLEEHRCHLERLVESRTQALSAAKEAAEIANHAKSHFLAAASHDLRQPLQAIRLFNDALAMSGLNERQKKIGKALSKSVSSLNELLNDLLDLSRLDAGTIEPQPVAIPAENVLEAIGLDFDAVCQEKNLQLKLVCPRRDLVLFSDENLLLTLLRNLVSNAVKYTKRGGILVGVRRRGDCALIQVWDTGIGIPAELRDSIFEEYFQIDNPERDRAKGVGLGLAIVRRLSKLLGVGVRLNSREGKGSVFEVTVPLARGSDVPASPLSAAATLETEAPSRLAGKRIVAIDDDGTAGEAIKLALEMEGAQVILFDTPKDALGSAEVMGADYYISDYRLPGMNGLQLLDAIQKNSVEPIKAVLLTGNVSPDQIASLRSSRWKVVLKPIALAELLAALDVQDAQHRAAGRSWCVTGH